MYTYLKTIIFEESHGKLGKLFLLFLYRTEYDVRYFAHINSIAFASKYPRNKK